MTEALPRLTIEGPLTTTRLVEELARLLSAVSVERLREQRWFGAKAQAIQGLSLRDVAPFTDQPPAVLALVDVRGDNGTTDTYFLPLIVKPLAEAQVTIGEDLAAALLQIETAAGDAVLYDAAVDPAVGRSVLAAMADGRVVAGAEGRFTFATTPAIVEGYQPNSVGVLRGQQSNTSLLCDANYVLKFYRKLQNGPNPDLEVPRFLTTRAAFRHTPAVAGFVEYESPTYACAVANFTAFVANEGDGWTHTLAQLSALYDHVTQLRATGGIAGDDVESSVRAYHDSFLRELRRLGEVTAEMHLALTTDDIDPDFAPEPASAEDLRDWLEGMEAQLDTALRLAGSSSLAGAAKSLAKEFVAAGASIRARLRRLSMLAGTDVVKIRHHGDFHLGQVLKTANGFAILDFEGEPARPLAQRRAKHLALRDVAGMLRSFNYAVYASLDARNNPTERELLEHYGLAWERLAGDAFREGYNLQTHGTAAHFLPASADAVDALVEILSLDKAVYELIYELNNRPAWAHIPLSFIARLGR